PHSQTFAFPKRAIKFTIKITFWRKNVVYITFLQQKPRYLVTELLSHVLQMIAFAPHLSG
ncbi:TPA: hypothetical protein ACIJR1_003821, partial [Klebsiella aerogenes]